jgi:hypothetical protein
MHVLVYGGVSYSYRRRDQGWPEFSEDAVADAYGLTARAFGMGRIDDRVFIILRELQGERAGGYPFTLLIDPGEQFWGRFGWNAARAIASLFQGGQTIGDRLLRDAAQLSNDALDEAFGSLPLAPVQRALTESREMNNPREVWVDAMVSDAPIVVQAPALGLTARPSIEWMTAMLEGLPTGFRPGKGWLIGGGAGYARHFGVHLILDDSPLAKPSRPVPTQRYWTDWQRIWHYAPLSRILEPYNQTPVWRWPEPVGAVMAGVAELAGWLDTSDIPESWWERLALGGSADPPFAEDVRNVAYEKALSGTGEMSDGQARFVLAHAASHPVKLNASVLDRVLPVRLAQIFRERRFRPWEACDALPLSPHQRRNVVDQYLSAESMDDLPSALLELSRSIVMDLNSIRAATSQVTRVASWSGPLKVWLLMQNSLLWDLLAPKIAVWARVRMDQGANGWADDYLFFGDAANPPADRVSTLANALLELWDDPAFELKQRERWTRVIADPAIRANVPLETKVRLARRADTTEVWQPFRFLLYLFYGDASATGRPQLSDSERNLLNQEFSELLRSSVNLKRPPLLEELVDWLDIQPRPDLLAALENMNPPRTDRSTWQSWVGGLEALKLFVKWFMDRDQTEVSLGREEAQRVASLALFGDVPGDRSSLPLGWDLGRALNCIRHVDDESLNLVVKEGLARHNEAFGQRFLDYCDLSDALLARSRVDEKRQMLRSAHDANPDGFIEFVKNRLQQCEDTAQEREWPHVDAAVFKYLCEPGADDVLRRLARKRGETVASTRERINRIRLRYSEGEGSGISVKQQ